MKQIIFAIVVLLVIASCGSGQAKKTEKGEAVKEISNPENAIDQGIASPDTLKNNADRFQASKEETEEDKERKLNIKRARTAFKNGVEYSKRGEMEKAKDAFKTVLEYDSENDRACSNLGNIFYGMGQKDIALSYFEDAVRFNPEDSASMVGVGLILFEKRDYNGAIEYYNMAIKMAPRYALAFYNRGTLLGFQNNYGGAVIDMNRAIEIDPNNSKYYMNRGLANHYLKRNQRACDDWEKAAMMGNAEAKKALGIYCKKIEE